MPKMTGRLLFSVVMFSLGAFLLAYSYSIPDVAAASSFGPQFYPRIILWGWLACAVAMMAEAALTAEKRRTQHWRGLAAAVALAGVACVAMPLTGFLPVSIAFMLAYPWALGYRRITILAPLSVTFSVAIWYTFNEILLIQLPAVPWLD
jgi:hypothetical protein